MAEYIDKSALYEKIAQLEELARNRSLETPSNNPCYSRYMEQLNERTAFKHIIADFPPADVAPVLHRRWLDVQEKRLFGDHYFLCSNCKSRNGTMIPFNYCFNCGSRMDLEET